MSPMDVPTRGVRVRASNRATSKASLGANSLVPSWLSRMVNCRYLACEGMMKVWVKLLLKGESSVRMAWELRMLAAPRVDQSAWVSKSPLRMPIRGSELRGACKAFPPSPTPPLPHSKERTAFRICRSIREGSLRTPGEREVFIRSKGYSLESRWLPSFVRVVVKLSPWKNLEPLMVWMWRSNSV